MIIFLKIRRIYEIQGFRASGLQGFRASGLQGFRASGLQGFKQICAFSKAHQSYSSIGYNKPLSDIMSEGGFLFFSPLPLPLPGTERGEC